EKGGVGAMEQGVHSYLGVLPLLSVVLVVVLHWTRFLALLGPGTEAPRWSHEFPDGSSLHFPTRRSPRPTAQYRSRPCQIDDYSRSDGHRSNPEGFGWWVLQCWSHRSGCC